MIKIEILSKKYGTKKALQNINIEFQKGIIYGIEAKMAQEKQLYSVVFQVLKSMTAKYFLNFNL